ncbi:FAD linked oxidase domain protein [Methanosalsum zhilinae DSM 4017]|uniref:FAD linked oxidase domain protein n=1 Tax=Methanosalsum zhilinae (strain DSM 4017 / NBRC 107636 / OCM 62 / WeN5) TaxID=679901 RepID=F7XN52_METZD|nr:FAD-binding oxidoreductase [Methanosalsum zhilinae]AEH61170.1 FAD linked oxidase domain protein [Methanosalsum zhilinae DSM 4017]
MREQIDQAALEELRRDFKGQILLPSDPAYNDARQIYNGMIDRRPAIIAQCNEVEDVVQAVLFGRKHDLEIAVRSGGHSVEGWGLTDGGIVIDMRKMNSVRVDPVARIAYVGGGATWRDVDSACQPHDLATTGGTISTTGVAGITLGGGWGYLARKLGLACDNLISVELVTADGSIVVTSEEDNPELFWALHGGGGNFGVATSFTFRLHHLPATTLALLVFSPTEGPNVIRRFRDVIERSAPDELSGEISYMTGPPEDPVPPELVNQLCLFLELFYVGPEDEMRKFINPLMELEPEGVMISELPYADIQSAFDMEPGLRNYWTAQPLEVLSDEAVELFCKRAYDMIVPSNSIQVLSSWGGAIARQDDKWPMGNRKSAWLVYSFGQWTDPADDKRGIAWANALCSDMIPHATEGTYLNLITNEGRERIIAGYGRQDKYKRLARVKAKYDPHNVFHMNHNIRPD